MPNLAPWGTGFRNGAAGEVGGRVYRPGEMPISKSVKLGELAGPARTCPLEPRAQCWQAN